MMIEMVRPLVRWVSAARSFESRSNEDFHPAGLYTIYRYQVIEMGCGILAWERNEVATCNIGDCRMTKGTQSKLQIDLEVLGALTVDSTYVQVSPSASFEPDSILMETPINSGTTRQFDEFAPTSSHAMAANTETMGTSLFVTCLEMVNITSDKIYLRALATVDQDWKKQGSGDDAPFPPVAPQSHIIKSRTNADWDFLNGTASGAIIHREDLLKQANIGR
ncbi:hypothetical protein PsorP6_007376 [Peronosclerospora sorghi]|uniref:Uncharacterized protein n=1 Tax=Peronosclerospora sorghi TaxID=230839 RepID=A0ACC0W7H4_9STRA|nr:hypothetical protein PsorP6_007376 [Peronosclerospora sorghi]